MFERRNPAIVAGLLGGALVAWPRPAQALSLEPLIAHPVLALVLGAAAGALVAGSAFGIAGLIARHSRMAGAHAPAQVAPEAPAPVERGPRSEHGARLAASVYRPRHMAPADWEESGHIRVQEPMPDEAHVGETRFDAEYAASGHAARDYVDIAQNYVRREGFRERMATRAQGVAATLRDRIGSNMMEGIPVIARADGTVGDVGTGWWERSVGADAISSNTGFAPEDAIPSDFTQGVGRAWEAPVLPDADLVPEARQARVARSNAISSRVAPVDEGAYPERRAPEDPSSGDEMWASALAALDERIAAQAAVPAPFVDPVGDAETLDEPDNLEPDTQFIMFRAPAGHPEVVDTTTYVDYLIDDEFSRNSSRSVRRSSRNYLRMLEGGSSRHLVGSPGTGYVGRHFAADAQLPEAAEA